MTWARVFRSVSGSTCNSVSVCHNRSWPAIVKTCEAGYGQVLQLKLQSVCRQKCNPAVLQASPFVLSNPSASTEVNLFAFILATTSTGVSVSVFTTGFAFILLSFLSRPVFSPKYGLVVQLPLRPKWRLPSSAATFTSVSVSQFLTAFTCASLSAILLADVFASTTGTMQTGVSAFTSVRL